MSDGEKKFIYIMLIVIAVSSCILIFKIIRTPKYDPKIYEKVYSEYENIMEKAENVANNSEDNNGNNNSTNSKKVIYKYVDADGNAYTVEGEIAIPKIGTVYPVVCETSDEYLKVAPTKLFGPNMNEVGNYCIAGHNYRNDQFFSKLSKSEINDVVYLTAKNGKKLTYKVYAKYEVNENDLSCTEQNTNGKIEATLITCTNQKKNRLIIKCRAS